MTQSGCRVSATRLREIDRTLNTSRRTAWIPTYTLGRWAKEWNRLMRMCEMCRTAMSFSPLHSQLRATIRLQQDLQVAVTQDGA